MCSLIWYNKYAVIIQDAHIKHGKEFEIIRSVYIYYSFFLLSDLYDVRGDIRNLVNSGTYSTIYL